MCQLVERQEGLVRLGGVRVVRYKRASRATVARESDHNDIFVRAGLRQTG